MRRAKPMLRAKCARWFHKNRTALRSAESFVVAANGQDVAGADGTDLAADSGAAEWPESLDLCCGTGDLSFALQRKTKGRLWGADCAHTMLERAKEKDAAEAGDGRRIPFVESDALHVAFCGPFV
jgi:predicted TPR repeat methyltransferase